MKETLSEYYLKKKGLKSIQELSTTELAVLITANEWSMQCDIDRLSEIENAKKKLIFNN